MKSAVITGADGFLGSHFTRKCAESSTEVWAVVHPASPNAGRISGVPGVHVVVSDIPGLSSKRDLFPESTDAFYHFAWQGVNADDRDNFDVQTGNIGMALDAVRLAGSLHARKFITPGSTNEYLYYGRPIDQNAVPSPSNAYGSVKVAVRFLAQSLAEKFGMEFVYPVITGIYAADRKDNNVLFYTIEKLLRHEKPSLTRLEQLWDYVYIDDVVEALSLLGDNGRDGVLYAIGKGDNQPLYRYIEQIRDLIDPALPLGIGEIPYRNGWMPCSCVDLAAIHRDTGFVPRVEFEDGIRRVIAAIKEEKKEKERK